jgi:hypothetical protein
VLLRVYYTWRTYKKSPRISKNQYLNCSSNFCPKSTSIGSFVGNQTPKILYRKLPYIATTVRKFFYASLDRDAKYALHYYNIIRLKINCALNIIGQNRSHNICQAGNNSRLFPCKQKIRGRLIHAPEVRINWTSSWLSYLPVLMTLAKTVSLSQGRMETKSITSQEMPSFSWAKVATSRNTCTYNAAHNKKEKSPGKLDPVPYA